MNRLLSKIANWFIHDCKIHGHEYLYDYKSKYEQSYCAYCNEGLRKNEQGKVQTMRISEADRPRRRKN